MTTRQITLDIPDKVLPAEKPDKVSKEIPMISNPSRHLPSSLFPIGLIWLLSLAAPANGQEILPFPPTPSRQRPG